MDIDGGVEFQVTDNNIEHVFTRIPEANFPTQRKDTLMHI